MPEFVEAEIYRRTAEPLIGDLVTVALGFGLRGRLVLDGHTASTVDDRRRPVAVRPEHVRLQVVAGCRVLELEDQLRLASA